MKDIIVAKRYAKALFELAKEQNKIKEIENELLEVLHFIQNDERLQKFLTHPSIQVATKIDLLTEIFQGYISQLTQNALGVIIKTGRIDIVHVMVTDYIKIANEALGQARAIVHTPHMLSAVELNQIANKFSGITGKTIVVEMIVDPSLLGGIQVRIGDRIYDGSVSGQLNRISRMLEQIQVS